MIRKKPAPHLMRGVQRFSLATNAKGVCAEIMLNQRIKARWWFIQISSRFKHGSHWRDEIRRTRRAYVWFVRLWRTFRRRFHRADLLCNGCLFLAL